MRAIDLAVLTERPGARIWSATPYGFVAAWPLLQSNGTWHYSVHLILDGVVDPDVLSALTAKLREDVLAKLDSPYSVEVHMITDHDALP